MRTPEEKFPSLAAFSRAKDRLIFIHIPKCGGSSVHSYFRNIFGRDRYMHLPPGESAKGIVVPHAVIGAGGHHRIGRSPAESTSRNVVYLSFVRDPFERFMSLWKHVRCGKPSPAGDHPGAREMSPPEFARLLIDKYPHAIDNCQCRFLSANWIPQYKDAQTTIAKQKVTVLPVSEIDNFIEWFSSGHRKAPIRLRANNSSPSIEYSRAERDEAESLVMEYNMEDLWLFTAYASITSPLHEKNRTASFWSQNNIRGRASIGEMR